VSLRHLLLCYCLTLKVAPPVRFSCSGSVDVRTACMVSAGCSTTDARLGFSDRSTSASILYGIWRSHLLTAVVRSLSIPARLALLVDFIRSHHSLCNGRIYTFLAVNNHGRVIEMSFNSRTDSFWRSQALAPSFPFVKITAPISGRYLFRSEGRADVSSAERQKAPSRCERAHG
jgi:hypothetical protein